MTRSTLELTKGHTIHKDVKSIIFLAGTNSDNLSSLLYIVDHGKSDDKMLHRVPGDQSLLYFTRNQSQRPHILTPHSFPYKMMLQAEINGQRIFISQYVNCATGHSPPTLHLSLSDNQKDQVLVLIVEGGASVRQQVLILYLLVFFSTAAMN